MPKKRDEFNPLEAKRRWLQEQERLLAQKRRELKEQLQSGGAPDAAARVDQPPVWRLEDDHHDRPVESYSARPPRHLGRQRQRDLFVFLCMGLLLLAIGVLLWIAWIHTSTPGRSA